MLMGKVSPAILVPSAAVNKLPQTLWLQPTEIHALTVLEVRTLNEIRWAQVYMLAGWLFSRSSEKRI